MRVNSKSHSLLLLLTLLVLQANARFFVNRVSNKCLDDQARIEDCTGGKNQQWDLKTNGQLYNRNTKTCLDASSTISIYLYTCGTADSQKWTFTSGGQLKNKKFNKCLHPKNPYVPELVDCATWYDQRWGELAVRRFVNRESKKCMEDDGSSARLEICTLKQTQHWELLENGRIRNVGSQRCLDASDSSVYPYKCGGKSRQEWIVTTNGEIKNKVSSKCLHPKNPYVAEEIACSYKTEQYWDATASRVFVNRKSQKCLDEGGGSGARLEDCVSSSTAQTWEMRTAGKLYNLKSRTCLTLSKDKTFIFTYDCWVGLKGESREFSLTSLGQIKNTKTGKCLHPKNANVPELIACKSTKDQFWDRKKGCTRRRLRNY